jgi:asparagine synthase (glutamine-hydrolysing)
MPGLTLWLTADAGLSSQQRRFSEAQACMVHGPTYAASLDVRLPGRLIGAVRYPEYPLRFFEAGGYRIAVEGRIYNKTDDEVADELGALAPSVFKDGGDPSAGVREWMLAAEGDYLVVLADLRWPRVAVLSDPLGRLPVYYRAGPRELILARECKFIRTLAGDVPFDRIGWAQTLWVGYPLGQRTLLADVQRGPAGLFLRAWADSGEVRTEVVSLVDLNLEEKQPPGHTVEQCADVLADEFVETCRWLAARQASASNVVALSGGQDSRAVAAGLAGAGVPFAAVTYDDGSAIIPREAAAAEQVAACLSAPWFRLTLPTPGPSDAERLVRLKDGLNYVGMAYILSFLEQIVGRWGSASVHFSGDGGDKVMPDLRVAVPRGGLDALVRVISLTHSILPPEEAERMLRLPRGTLLEDLRQRLAAYPESSMTQKAVHYVINERARKWLFEGEDRTRFYLWQVAPFWSFPFFVRAMSVPDKFKSGYRLYARFQERLSPACARIPNASHGCAMTSYRFRLQKALVGRIRSLPGPLGGLVWRWAGLEIPRAEVSPEFVAEWRRTFDQMDELADLLCWESVEHFLGRCNSVQFNFFRTLVLLAKGD